LVSDGALSLCLRGTLPLLLLSAAPPPLPLLLLLPLPPVFGRDGCAALFFFLSCSKSSSAEALITFLNRDISLVH
jgi:hypothetical protein